MDLSVLYSPITATPFSHAAFTQEVLPCAPLRPYVRCYWRSIAVPPSGVPALITPDTCVDLIFRKNAATGKAEGVFSALCDRPFLSRDPSNVLLGVRLYPWAAPQFAQDSLLGTKNGHFDARHHFDALADGLAASLDEPASFAGLCARVDALLMRHLEATRAPNALFLNAMHILLATHGTARIETLARDLHVSVRQLERLFARYTGASPKALGEGVRYQSLWREALFSPAFDVQDAVLRYGFTDQSHLLRQFRAFHGLPLERALRLARGEVAFLQDSLPSF